MRQYMPNKPINWGFKPCGLVISDLSSLGGASYVVDFAVYIGSQGVQEEGLTPGASCQQQPSVAYPWAGLPSLRRQLLLPVLFVF